MPRFVTGFAFGILFAAIVVELTRMLDEAYAFFGLRR